MSDDAWELTYAVVSEDDPMVHGSRWRRERDEAWALLRRIASEPAPPSGWGVHAWQLVRAEKGRS